MPEHRTLPAMGWRRPRRYSTHIQYIPTTTVMYTIIPSCWETSFTSSRGKPWGPLLQPHGVVAAAVPPKGGHSALPTIRQTEPIHSNDQLGQPSLDASNEMSNYHVFHHLTPFYLPTDQRRHITVRGTVSTVQYLWAPTAYLRGMALLSMGDS